ncbi:Thylakoid lumenal protein, chloroplastic [Sesamum alatum]|uniref:Thylakoid lumenal protein, chloroplastic n=1 Tax=Sesamum alatum TaxID=300844 RepID=A0AAE1YIC3_9LAMI|nr:Thylakoid lumenal protein, chloroplastic [Sesamum alatum]
MATTVFLPNAKAFLPSLPYPSSSSSTLHAQTVCCRAAGTEASSIVISRRSISFTTLLFTTLRGYSKGRLDDANAAILEADDDEELLEKVKKDRKKRLERQGVISSSAKETAYLQDLVYKLSKVGQAIEKNDLSAASSVLGSSKDTEWVQKVNSAFNKLSSSEEEKTEVDTFNSSLASLISSVSRNDIEASKVAFVASATAFEKWTTLSGLVEQLKGL